MAKVSVTFELDNVTDSQVVFDLHVYKGTPSGPVDIAHDSVIVDVPVAPVSSLALSHQAPVVS